MKSKFQLLVVLVSYLFVIDAFASPLDSAFERMTAFDSDKWSFQVVSNGEENTLEEFHPNLSPEWSLVSVDGKKPSKKRVRQYLREKEEENEEGEESDDGKLDLREMIDLSSLTLQSNSGEVAVYTFVPILDEDEMDFSGKLKGELWHNKQGDFIERFDFFSVASFSPMAGVKIDKMKTSFQFKEIAPDIFAPDQITSSVSGKAFLVKKIEDNEVQSYINYRRVFSEDAE